MNTPKLSIIVVCTNEKKFLGPCLDSLYSALMNISYEIIVVDNASSDGSPEFVKEKYPDVILVQNGKNKGAAYARNRGIERSRGDYLMFLDCDTKVFPDTLHKLLNYVENNSHIGILSPQLLYPDQTLQYSARTFPNLFIFILRTFLKIDVRDLRAIKKSARFRKYFMADWDHNTIREVDWTMSAAWLIPRVVLNQVGGFDEGYFYNYEDVDLSWRVKRAGWKILYYPHVKVIHYYQRLSSRGGVFNPLKWYHLKSALRFFIKKAFS